MFIKRSTLLVCCNEIIINNNNNIKTALINITH